MQGKVVLITGGTSGIGRACAVAFGQAGARVAVTGRDEARLRETAEQLRALGIDARTIRADVASEADCRRAVEETVQAFGRLDVLLNNAGISMRALFQDAELEVIQRLMQTNFFGTVYTTKYALPHVLAARGSVVGVSSIAGYRGLPGRTGYSASKFAMQGFLEALRTEVHPQGVHVLTACPGFTSSNIRNTALAADGSQQGESPRDENQMMSSEEVARHILHAVQTRKPTLVLTGKGRLTVFLNKWLPASIMDRLVLNEFQKEKNSPVGHKPAPSQ
ncbi:SDR family oxidoreductase [Hymenobacter busanensis]|uniref:SDR family oxidoreductase n=1 Tax=Hymenobacter busanensis TaxID=2607656 RepID=A0A7L4ZS73_9BACT|nr:SDR family oxidoreductase [Hymenobacter busanensis]KAA9327222.1 SDR family oxidoreductase [Hymenobacter busanensis]QHJ05888.1 SDR family oxidoreductase [Hymenobacter busanensis]